MPIIKGKFPSDKDLERIKEENNYHKLYKCEVYDDDEKKGVFRLKALFSSDRGKKEILTIAINIPSIIVDVTVAMLFGEEVTVKVGEDEEGKENEWQKRVDRIWKDNDIDELLRESGKSFEYTGHTQYMVRSVPRQNKEEDEPENEAIISEVPFDNWFPDHSGVVIGGKPNTFYVVAYISKQIEGKTQPERYIYVQCYSMEKKNESSTSTAIITHTLWRERDGRAQEQVAFNRLPGLLESIGKTVEKDKKGDDISVNEIIQDTELNELPVFQIDTKKTVKDKYGKSVYKAAMPLFEEINDRTTQMSLQFWKHLDPIVQVPKSAVPKDRKGRVKREKLDVILTEEGMPDAKYIVNENPQIEEAMNFLQSMILLTAKETYTPPDLIFESEKGAGVESDETLKTRWLMPIKKYNSYMGTFTDALEKMLKIALKYEYPDEQKEIDNLEMKFDFDFGLPQDFLKKVTFYVQATAGGLMSLSNAISALQGLEGKQLEEEIEKIREDERLHPVFSDLDTQ